MNNQSFQEESSDQNDEKAKKWKPRPITQVSFEDRYLDSTKETLRVLYANRVPGEEGETTTTETTTDIIWRVSKSVAIAELKYQLKPEELIELNIEDALHHPVVSKTAEEFAFYIGNQYFWANTPANINANPEIALKVLQYWAHGTLHGYQEEDIWLESDKLMNEYSKGLETTILSKHQIEMGRLANDLKNKGCLAACGVAYVTDSLEGIQEAARIEAMATKASMGMGLNTSPLRPWASLLSTGAYSSGPDRFYEKTISKAVEAVAQGGRRGGALIELRDSNHPDILFFIDKKKLTPPPAFANIFKKLHNETAQNPGESARQFKSRVLKMAEKVYGEQFADYTTRQGYLKNTNITVLAMPGFMEAAKEKKFFPTEFKGKFWNKKVFDPRKPTGDIDKLTKEKVFHEYSINLDEYPEAIEAVRFLPKDAIVVHKSPKEIVVRGYLYGPDVLNRIIEGMHDSGEPGIMFWDTVNDANANSHAYDLNTCNPCGEQCLPAGPGKDGRTYMGNCNLSSLHAAHEAFWKKDGSYDHSAMKRVVEIQQRFMDNVTDVSWYPLTKQNMTARMERRNGGGFAGIAEYISRLGLRFGQEEGITAAAQLFQWYTEASVACSKELAKSRGVYPLWKGSKYEQLGIKMRNSCLVNNAPTGTLAQAMQTSWGVDPHNGIVFSRIARYRKVDFMAPGFEFLMRKHNAWPQTEEQQTVLIDQIKKNNKSVQGLSTVPEAVQKAFAIRVEVSPEEYIRHLAAIHFGASSVDKYAFNAVSNTCSIPLNFSKQEIQDAVFLAYELGVKDLTFYPDGSRNSQPVEKIAEADYEVSGDLLDELEKYTVKDLDVGETVGKTFKVRVGTPDEIATMHVSLNHMENSPGELVEVYARMGKSGALEGGLFEALGRISSAFLQYAAKYGSQERQRAEDLIVKQLIGINSGNPVFHKFANDDKGTTIFSPCDGLAKTISQYRKSMQPKELENKTLAEITDQSLYYTTTTKVIGLTNTSKKPCTQCGGSTTKLDGCTICDDCGFSKCG